MSDPGQIPDKHWWVAEGGDHSARVENAMNRLDKVAEGALRSGFISKGTHSEVTVVRGEIEKGLREFSQHIRHLKGWWDSRRDGPELPTRASPSVAKVLKALQDTRELQSLSAVVDRLTEIEKHGLGDNLLPRGQPGLLGNIRGGVAERPPESALPERDQRGPALRLGSPSTPDEWKIFVLSAARAGKETVDLLNDVSVFVKGVSGVTGPAPERAEDHVNTLKSSVEARPAKNFDSLAAGLQSTGVSPGNRRASGTERPPSPAPQPRARAQRPSAIER